MECNLSHASLDVKLIGCVQGATHQYRGIPYGSITQRFATPSPHTIFKDSLLCKDYGPRCPQNVVDVRHLLRLPAHASQTLEAEHEFDCLNLDVVCPSSRSATPLPVLIWIHGGSQIVTFASAASGICAPQRLVQEANELKRPFIFVSVNYRLNIFAFGDGTTTNLALKDQSLAIAWVRQHIAGFGGDPNRITLAGESAGAVYCHAHMVMGAPVEQLVLSSGSLYLSPPQPKQRGLALVKSLQEYIETTTSQSLRSASVESLLTGLRELNINTMWLQMEPGLEEWPTRTGCVKRLVVGDVEYESVIWANGIRSMTGEEVIQAFDNIGSTAQDLKDLYGIMPDRPAACHIGALDFLNDVLFALPVEKIQHYWRKTEQAVFRYLLDQPNPWQTSHRAHHAVDLLFLFGSNDMSFDRAADRVGHELRARWIAFINGDDPWSTAKTFAFGPVGECRELEESEIASHRRKRHIDFLRTCDTDNVSLVVKSLAAGRISLLN